jgi:hypothetical protein
VRRLDGHLRVYPERHRRDALLAGRYRVEYVQLALGLHVDEENVGRERLVQLARRFPGAAEDDVAPREAGAAGPVELSARDNVDAGAELAQERQDGEVRVRLHAVMDAVPRRPERPREAVVLLADRGRAVDVRRRPDRRGEALERHALAGELRPHPGEPGR